jgi:hypothetical protein
MGVISSLHRTATNLRVCGLTLVGVLARRVEAEGLWANRRLTRRLHPRK